MSCLRFSSKPGIAEMICFILLTGPFVAKAAPISTSMPTADQAMYLMRYGYLPMSESSNPVEEFRSSDEVTEAVRRLQWMAGLPSTGQFDAQTTELISRPRCGYRDVLLNDGAPENFEVGPSTWPRTELTYRVINNPVTVSNAATSSSVRAALKLWSDESSLSFSESHPNADIEVSFATRYHNDGYQFDGKGGVLAHAFPPGEGRGGDVHFDNEETWAVKPADGTSIYAVAAHEFGHSLGIRHSNVQGSLMFPWYNQQNPIVRLHQDDIKAITHLYGARKGQKPVPTRRPSTVLSTTTLSWQPDYGRTCAGRFDAVTTIDRTMHVFHGQNVWQLSQTGDVIRTTSLSSLWPRLPPKIDAVDAIYQRVQDGIVVVFRGARYWEFHGSYLLQGFPTNGMSLSQLGLPSHIKKIDAAFVGLGSTNRRTYLVSDHAYWGLKDGPYSRQFVDYGYPRDMAYLRGVPAPVDAAFTDLDGKTYFFKGDFYWQFNATKLEVSRGFPRPITDKWNMCTDNYRYVSAATTLAVPSFHGYRCLLSLLFVLVAVALSSRWRAPVSSS